MNKLKARWTVETEQELDFLKGMTTIDKLENINLKRIGYWRSNDGREYIEYPIAKECINNEWDGKEKELVIGYLCLDHHLYSSYLGWSNCRICGNINGDSEFTDGVWLWPEGYLHYIMLHNIKPYQEFINWCRIKLEKLLKPD